jgi:bifunctional non-homologous end joining protein LigD
LALAPEARPRPSRWLEVWGGTVQAAPCCEYATRQDNAAETSGSGIERRISPQIAYLSGMPFDFCLPTKATNVPHTPDWLHEVKYDGYRLRLERDGDRVRLITRNGHNWTDRYPWIVEAALKNRIRQFVIDGEAVVLGIDGIADFNALHSRQHDDEVQLYAFDILALDGEDLRSLPLSMRKTNLARLLARRPDGIFVAPFEQGEIGPDLFRAACRMGLEGLYRNAVTGPTKLDDQRTGSR